MKKRILLLATMIMLFAFVLSISVLAEAYEPNRTTIEYNGQSVSVITSDATVEDVASKLGNNATMQGLFKDDNALVILADNNGNLFAFPTWYIIEPKDNNTSYVAVSEVEYTFVNTLVEGSTFARGAVRYIEFPHGMTDVRANSVFGGSEGMYEVNVTEIHIPNTVSSIGKGAFENRTGNSQLKYVYIEKGNGIKKIEGTTFSNSNVEYFQFENLTELEEIDGFSNSALACDIDLSNSKLKIIWTKAFIGSTGIKKITLPNTVEKIENSAFENIGSGYLASPYLPSSLTYVGERFFAYNDNLLETYIFPVGVKAIGNEPFQDSKVAGGPAGKELNLVFLGEVTGIVYLNGNGHQKHAEKVTVYFAQNSLDQYNKNGFYVKPSGSSVTSVPGAIRVAFCKGTGAGTNGSVTGVEYIYLTNVAGTSYTSDMVNDAEYGFDFDNHTHYGLSSYKANTCAENGYERISCIVCDKNIETVLNATGDHDYVEGTCTVCGKKYCTSGSEHIIVTDVIYENGFLNGGIIVNKCQSEGCEYFEKTGDIDPMFTTSGYSLPENGTNSIAIGFTVNYNAISVYESTTKKTVDFGVFAVSQSNLGENDIFSSDGKASNGVIYADVAGYEFASFELKISGFSGEYMTMKFAMGAYVITAKDGVTEYAYLQDEAPSQGEKYHFVSFEEIKNN